MLRESVPAAATRMRDLMRHAFLVAARCFIAAFATACLAVGASAAERLPALNADATSITVSGVSSGGYMAVQMQVAHSATVRGAGVIAAGPYDCAQGNVFTAMYGCMSPGFFSPLPDVKALKAATEGFAAAGSIDATSNLAGTRVWLFSGTKDKTVKPEVVAAAAAFFRLYAPRSSIEIERSTAAGHAMITTDVGSACAVTAPPYINACDFDAAGALLKFIQVASALPSSSPRGKLLAFDQREFAGGNAYAISMGDAGYAYVPQACERERCRIHVAFHGCKQGAETIGDLFARSAGYNRWADTNHLIVLYPQAIARYGWGGFGFNVSFVFNPSGCWDWWGYTGADYATRTGPQIRAVQAMIDRLAMPRAIQP